MDLLLSLRTKADPANFRAKPKKGIIEVISNIQK